MEFRGCLNDDAFGPTVRGCRGDFDFTIKFERVFLSLIPAALFITTSFSRTIYLVGRPVIVGGALLRNVKLFALAVYAALWLALLILSCTNARNLESLFISSAAVELVSALCMIVLSPLEHSRSPRPSIFLNAYLFLTLLLGIAQTRTLWLAAASPDEITFSRLFTTTVAVKVALIVLESQHKSKCVRWDVKEHSPEETAGLFGLGAFSWLNRLFLQGFKEILTLDGLFPLDHNMASETLQAKLMKQVAALKAPNQKYGLAKALAKTLAVPLLIPVGPRTALGAFQFCQPFLIHALLDYLQEPEETAPRNVGYGLIGAAGFTYAGIAASSAFYWYFQERALWMARGALAGAVYKKTTEARLSDADDSAALTLMSTDVERIRVGFLFIHEFWANTIEVALACWLLERQLGAAFAAPLVVVVCCAVAASIFSKRTKHRQKAWMESIQKRVGLTSKVIAHMKHLKISGLATPVEGLIQKLRVSELKAGSRWRMVIIIASTISWTPLALSPLAAFAVTSRTLDVTTIFTSLSFLLLLSTPLGIIFQQIPGILAAFTCLARIQAFLEKDPRVDFRESALDISGEKPSNDHSGRLDTAVMISGGSFGWESDQLNLKGIDINIPASRLTIVIGPVASGKSTLCKALLGETPVFGGKTSVQLGSRRVGYCDQVPHLTNATIRENIVGFAAFDQARYHEVIEATALQLDLDMLPQGDETKVGSNGITLSGGQKQRVSMARALYLNSRLLIFDDILSGLDADTEEQVFARVFGAHGLLRRQKATAVLCTHSVRHLPAADHIVALGPDGNLVEQGTFDNLVGNGKYVHSLGVKAAIEIKSEDAITPAEARPAACLELLKSLPAQSRASSIADEQGRMMGSRGVYRHYLSTVDSFSIATFLLGGATFGFCYNFSSIWLKFWSEDAVSPEPRRSNAFYIGLYALFQVSCLGCNFLIAWMCLTRMVSVSGAKLHKSALRTVINAPLSFFTTTDAGVVTNLFSQDMTLIDGELPQSLLNLSIDTWASVGLAAVIATSSPWLVITYPFLAVILWGVQKFYLRTSRQLRLLDLEAKSPLYTHFQDTIKGVATFRAFGWVQDGIDLNNRLLDTSQRPAYLLAMVQRWLSFTLQLIIALLALAVVTLATQLHSNTAFTGAGLVAIMMFGDNLTFIIRMYTLFETSIGAVGRLKSFCDVIKPEDQEGEDVVPGKEWPLKGGIKLDRVSASYGDIDRDITRESTGSGDSSQGSRDLALVDLSLTIAPGEKVAICGRSGSGKSSTILVLLRLLDPIPSRAQSITIDDQPLHEMDRRTLRERIISVPQDPVFLPDGTPFRASLDPLGVSTEHECRAVLEAVDLWDLVAQRGGLAAGMWADALSQGQRQLFSLARAVVRRRVRGREHRAAKGTGAAGAGEGGILLLDEVSSSVDRDTDRAMQRVIRDEFAAYTVVMVSHRLDMVLDLDTVVVMDRGSAVERGRPRELVETEGSRFRELWLVGNTGEVG